MIDGERMASSISISKVLLMASSAPKPLEDTSRLFLMVPGPEIENFRSMLRRLISFNVTSRAKAIKMYSPCPLAKLNCYVIK